MSAVAASLTCVYPLRSYPTLVIRGTGLYELWKTGAYKNYPPEQLVDLVARVLAMVCVCSALRRWGLLGVLTASHGHV